MARQMPNSRKDQKGGGHMGFAALESELAAKGASDPAALAAWIGRRKYGAGAMAAMAAAGKGSNKK